MSLMNPEQQSLLTVLWLRCQSLFGERETFGSLGVVRRALWHSGYLKMTRGSEKKLLEYTRSAYTSVFLCSGTT